MESSRCKDLNVNGTWLINSASITLFTAQDNVLCPWYVTLAHSLIPTIRSYSPCYLEIHTHTMYIAACSPGISPEELLIVLVQQRGLSFNTSKSIQPPLSHQARTQVEKWRCHSASLMQPILYLYFLQQLTIYPNLTFMLSWKDFMIPTNSFGIPNQASTAGSESTRATPSTINILHILTYSIRGMLLIWNRELIVDRERPQPSLPKLIMNNEFTTNINEMVDSWEQNDLCTLGRSAILIRLSNGFGLHHGQGFLRHFFLTEKFKGYLLMILVKDFAPKVQVRALAPCGGTFLQWSMWVDGERQTTDTPY